MDESRSPSATAASPPTHTPGSTAPRHGNRGHRPVKPPRPRTITTRQGPRLETTTEDPTILTNMNPPATNPTMPDPNPHKDPTAVGPVGPTTTSPPNPIPYK